MSLLRTIGKYPGILLNKGDQGAELQPLIDKGHVQEGAKGGWHLTEAGQAALAEEPADETPTGGEPAKPEVGGAAERSALPGLMDPLQVAYRRLCELREGLGSKAEGPEREAAEKEIAGLVQQINAGLDARGATEIEHGIHKEVVRLWTAKLGKIRFEAAQSSSPKAIDKRRQEFEREFSRLMQFLRGQREPAAAPPAAPPPKSARKTKKPPFPAGFPMSPRPQPKK